MTNTHNLATPLGDAFSMPVSKKSQKRTKIGELAIKVPKSEPQPGSSAFKQLQERWYKKLAKAGHKEIENKWGLFNGQSSTDKRWQERYVREAAATIHYYNRWACFGSSKECSSLPRLNRAVVRLYAKGMTYVEIANELKPKFKEVTYVMVHYLVNHMKSQVEIWNRKHPDGMDFIADIGSEED